MNKNYPIRVLQVTSGDKQGGGVESFLMNIYRRIDKSKIQFDFLTPSHSTMNNYKEEIEKLGGNIYELNAIYNKYTRLFQLMYLLPSFYKKNNYKYNIVHVNAGSISTEVSLNLISFLCNIPTRIAHSHNTGNEKNLIFKVLQYISKLVLKLCATDYFACSKKAARRLFFDKDINSGKVKIIKNAIDFEKFIFNPEKRRIIREKLGIENSFVVGNISRFVPEKNHEYLIKVFSELQKIKSDSKLVLIGNGVLEEKVKLLVEDLNLKDKVLFLGERKDVNDLLSALDIILMPSIFEGFPVTLVEAQVNGLPIYMSSNITKEVVLTDLVKSLDLNDSPKDWAKIIANSRNIRDNDAYKQKTLDEYRIENTVKYLTDFYINKNKQL